MAIRLWLTDLEGGFCLFRTPPCLYYWLGAALLARFPRPPRHTRRTRPSRHTDPRTRGSVPRHGVPHYLRRACPTGCTGKNGYLREKVPLTFLNENGGTAGQSEGLIYLASEDNPAFLGEAPLADMARQINQAHGPSGPNREYLLNLASALRELGVDDAHIFALEQQLDRLPGYQ